jgi:hypothetical protein
LGLARILSILSFASVRRQLTLRLARPVPIAELRTGHPQPVRGRVRALGETVQAPASGTTCLCYWITVERRDEALEMATVWMPVATAQAGTGFVLDDGTGQVLVDGSSTFEVVAPPWEELPHEVDLGNVRIAEFLRREGGDPGFRARRGDANSLRWTERLVRAGDTVAVLGTTQGPEPHAHGEPQGPRRPPMMQVVRGSSNEPLLIRAVE